MHGHNYWALRLACAMRPPLRLRVTPRTPEERRALGQLPSLMSAPLERPNERRLTLEPKLNPDPATGAVTLEARICDKAEVNAWIKVFKQKRLWLALDIDDTVLKAFRVSDYQNVVDAINRDCATAAVAYEVARKVRAPGGVQRAACCVRARSGRFAGRDC